MNEGSDKKLDTLIETVGVLSGKFDTLTGKVDTLTETVEFIKDNAAMQESLDNLETKLTGKIDSLRTEMHAGFANVEMESRSVRGEIKEVKEKVDRIDKRTEEDANALANDQIKTSSRLRALELQKGTA